MAGGLRELAGAFAWLKWRLFVNNVKATSRRDVLGKLARFAAPLTRFFTALMLVPTVVVVVFGAGLLGWADAAGEAEPDLSAVLLRLLGTIYVGGALVSPFFFGGKAAISATSRMLLLPIGRHQLYVLRSLAGFADPWLLSGGLALFGFAAGVAVGGEGRRALAGFLAAVVFIAATAALSSWVESLALLLLRDRRRREWAAMAFFLVVIAWGLAMGSVDDDVVAAFFDNLDVGTFILPVTLYARAALGEAVLGPVVGLALVAGLCYVLGERAWRRLLVESETVGGGGGRGGWGWGGSWPGLGEAASARATVEVRFLLRTVAGKLALLQGPFGVLFAHYFLRQVPAARDAAPPELLVLGIAVAMIVLALTVHLVNVLAIDRAGLSLVFVLPIEARDLVLAKTAGFAALGSLSLGLGFVPAWWLSEAPAGAALRAGLFALLTLLAALLATALPGVLLSALLPRPSNLSRALKHNQPHPLAVLAGMGCASFALAVPVAIVASGVVLGRPWTALLGLAGWLLAVAAFYRLLLPVVAAVVDRRREAILEAAQDR